MMLGSTLGVLSLGFAGVAWFTGSLDGMRATTNATAFLAAFSIVVTLACFLPASRPIALRLIGGIVFLVCLA